MDQKLIDLIRNTSPNKIAEELLSVQPVDPNLFKNAYNEAMSEEQLIAEGYEPVSHLKLMWRKKDGSQEESSAEKEKGTG